MKYWKLYNPEGNEIIDVRCQEEQPNIYYVLATKQEYENNKDNVIGISSSFPDVFPAPDDV